MIGLDLFARGRDVLARYGYARDGRSAEAVWPLLVRDFPFPVPEWGRLTPAQRRAAEDYLGLREAADRHLETCEALHLRLSQAGIGSDLVERYAAAREDYEEAVEAFGAARRRLEQALRRP